MGWLGPWQIANKILFWIPEYDEDGSHNETVWKFGEWLAQNKDGSPSKLTKFCEWIYSKQKRTVKVKIDNFDYWNAHNTASMILYPLLKMLKEKTHSTFFVKDEDAPEFISSKNAFECGDGVWDSNSTARYQWVMNEILFALECDQPDNNWEDKYTIQAAEIDWTKYPEDEGKTSVPVRWKVEGKYDWAGRQAQQDRINNGFRLLGVYYQSMWS